jgi:DNA-binding GntR family transcriptional regulator
LRALEDQRIRVERYILHLCRDPEAFADLRRGPDTLLEACRERDGAGAEAATRDALTWVLAELQRMLDNAGGETAETLV